MTIPHGLEKEFPVELGTAPCFQFAVLQPLAALQQILPLKRKAYWLWIKI